MQYKKIKTFEDACAALKLPTTLPVVKGLPAKHQESIVANYKLVIIAEAINEGWQPNWNDSNERKWEPWFTVKASAKRPSGFGLSFDGTVYWHTGTFVGSRLCFKSSELAEYAGKKFIKLYEQAYLLMQ